MNQDDNLLAENVFQFSQVETKASKLRWYILGTFMYYACLNTIQMTEYVSVTEAIARYYDVSTFAVNWTSLLYMVVYPILVIPASSIIQKQGLRRACLYGCLGTAAGTIIKVLSIQRTHFWVVMVGQLLTAASLVFIMCLPPKIAAVWFDTHEVSLACSLGTLGPNLGNAIGYILTVSIVGDSQNEKIMESSLKLLCWILSLFAVPVAISVLLYFPEKPAYTTSTSLIQEKITHKSHKMRLIKNILGCEGFVTHLIAYAINIAVLSTVMIFISEFVGFYFEDSPDDGGKMGFALMIVGLLGNFFFGVYLDKSRHYKETCVFTYISATIALVLLIAALNWKNKICAYVICSIFGFFINPFIPIGFEFGLELTYPLEESTVAGLLFAASQIFAVIFAVIDGYIKSSFGPFWALTVLAGLLAFGTLLELFVPNKLLRQRAFRTNQITSCGDGY